MESNNAAFKLLTVGKQYMFSFSHKKNVRGIVCEVDKTRSWFAIYDMSTGEYEGILSSRLRNCVLIG